MHAASQTDIASSALKAPRQNNDNPQSAAATRHLPFPKAHATAGAEVPNARHVAALEVALVLYKEVGLCVCRNTKALRARGRAAVHDHGGDHEVAFDLVTPGLQTDASRVLTAVDTFMRECWARVSYRRAAHDLTQL